MIHPRAKVDPQIRETLRLVRAVLKLCRRAGVQVQIVLQGERVGDGQVLALLPRSSSKRRGGSAYYREMGRRRAADALGSGESAGASEQESE